MFSLEKIFLDKDYHIRIILVKCFFRALCYANLEMSYFGVTVFFLGFNLAGYNLGVIITLKQR